MHVCMYVCMYNAQLMHYAYFIYCTHIGAFGKVCKGVLVTDIDGSLNETTVAIKSLKGKIPFSY